MNLEKLKELAEKAVNHENMQVGNTGFSARHLLQIELKDKTVLALISELTAAREVVEAAREVADDRLSLSDFEGKIMQIEETLEQYDKVKG